MKTSAFILLIFSFFSTQTFASSFQFLPSYELNEQRAELVNKLPQEFFLSSKKWNGEDLYIYHGTSLANAISMINSGQVIVDGNSNILVNGRGWYFFTSLAFAMSYGSAGGSKVTDDGMVLPAKIKHQAIILDWTIASKAPFFTKILLANGEDADLSPKKTFDEIARLGVDIVRWGPNSAEIIVLNKSAIYAPDDIADLAAFYGSIADGYEKKVFPPRNDPRILIERLAKQNLQTNLPSNAKACSKIFSLN